MLKKAFQKIHLKSHRNYVKREFVDYSLCFVTDSDMAKKSGKDLKEIVSQAIEGGCTMIQIREKYKSKDEFLKIAQEMKELCKDRVTLIINDNCQIASEINGDGVHIGQDDGSPIDVRNHIGSDKILGITVGNLNELKNALKDGADYLGTDAIFETSTKPGKYMGLTKLKEICENSTVPVIGIGGINESNVSQVLNCGLSGIAVVSNIINSPNPKEATIKLKNEILKVKEERLKHQISNSIEVLKKKNPLVHHITNNVVMNQSANITLIIGGSPIMSHAPEEMEDLIDISDSLLLNIGTITEDVYESMLIAGKRANKMNKPIILDPVGVGASKYRKKVVNSLLNELKISILKGNSAEISFLYGSTDNQQKGVDSHHSIENPIEITRGLSRKYNGMIVAMTGKKDYVSDGKNVIELLNESDLLPNITGTGCMVGSLIASFAGSQSNHLVSACAGISSMNISAELVESTTKGSYSFKSDLFDQIGKLNSHLFYQNVKLKIH